MSVERASFDNFLCPPRAANQSLGGVLGGGGPYVFSCTSFFLMQWVAIFKTGAFRFSKSPFFSPSTFDEVCRAGTRSRPNAGERSGTEHVKLHLKALSVKVPPDWGSESRNRLLTWNWSPCWSIFFQAELKKMYVQLEKKCAGNEQKKCGKRRKNWRVFEFFVVGLRTFFTNIRRELNKGGKTNGFVYVSVTISQNIESGVPTVRKTMDQNRTKIWPKPNKILVENRIKNVSARQFLGAQDELFWLPGMHFFWMPGTHFFGCPECICFCCPERIFFDARNAYVFVARNAFFLDARNAMFLIARKPFFWIPIGDQNRDNGHLFGWDLRAGRFYHGKPQNTCGPAKLHQNAKVKKKEKKISTSFLKIRLQTYL